MDKLTKFIIAVALTLLTVIIGWGIVNNRSDQERLRPLAPAELPPLSKEPAEKEKEIPASQEELRSKERQQPEVSKKESSEEIYISPEEKVLPPDMMPSLQPEFPFYPGYEEGPLPEFPPGVLPPGAYPPDELTPEQLPPEESSPPETLQKHEDPYAPPLHPRGVEELK